MFQHGNNLMFNGGTFSQSHQHYYIDRMDKGLNDLKQYIATDAMFDAAERFPPPKCHPGTREKIIKAIMDWIDDAEPEEQAMWLYGPAGAGKSAIAQSIAILLQETLQKRKYAASFFFSKDKPGRGDGKKLFATIAYQLAINFPSFRPHLDAAMINNPTLPTKSLDVQLRDLIIEPLKSVKDWPLHYPTVIIDGLDECSGSKRTQLALLSTLCKAITYHDIPLRFLIVSRPEYWIADYFQVGEFSDAAMQISLRDDTEAYVGIVKYLRDEFTQIYEENLPLMYSVPRPWPPDHLIERFANNASGQFVYASTVIKFVGDSSNFCDPQEQLRILATPGPHDASAFSDLDRLYATILSAYPRPESMKYVLGGILCDLHENVIQEFFGITLTESHLVLRAISSLIHIRNFEYPDKYRVLEKTYGPPVFKYDPKISFCHLSFKEFLQDQSRSGSHHFIDRGAFVSQVSCKIFMQGQEMLQSCLGDQVNDIEKSISRIGISIYRDSLFGTLTELVRGNQHLPLVVKAIQDMASILDTVLRRKPVRLFHASHILWFATNIISWLDHYKIPFESHQELLKSLQYNLYEIMDISIEQLFEETPIHMPVFSYMMAHSIWGLSQSIDDIMEDMDITYDDIISELQHLHSVVYLSFEDGRASVIGDLNVFPRDGEPERLVQDGQQIAAWEKIRLRHVASCKDMIMGQYWQFPRDDRDILWHHNTVGTYMDHTQLSDIDSPDYFQDGLRRTILDMVIDPGFPDVVKGVRLKFFVKAALYWLNRQLSGPRKTCIAQYDGHLLQTMQSAAKNIFLKAYLPNFTNEYSSNLVMNHRDPGLSVILRVSNRLPDGTHSIIEERHDGNQSPIDSYHNQSFYPGSIIDEVHKFQNTMLTSTSSDIISFGDWYPHLAAFLLTMLVRCEYGALNPGFEVNWARIPRNGFGLLLKCMPYAAPTEQNLNAMRVLHHLCPKIDRKRRWRPPFGFCSLTMDFLMKYDASSLSPLEFSRLGTWLGNLKTHESKRIVVDIKNRSYHAQDDYTTDEDA